MPKKKKSSLRYTRWGEKRTCQIHSHSCVSHFVDDLLQILALLKSKHGIKIWRCVLIFTVGALGKWTANENIVLQWVTLVCSWLEQKKCVCVCVCMRACTRVCVYACVCARVFLSMCVFTQVCAWGGQGVHAPVLACVSLCVFVHVFLWTCLQCVSFIKICGLN